MKVFKTNVGLKSFLPKGKASFTEPLDFVVQCQQRVSQASKQTPQFVFVSYKHYISYQSRRTPSNLISEKQVSEIATILDISPSLLCLTSDAEIECEEVTNNWWPQMIQYHRKIAAMFLTKRMMTQDHVLKFWFIAELLAAKEAGCAIIAEKGMATVVKTILAYVPDIDTLKRYIARGSIIDNSQAPGEIITPASLSEAEIKILDKKLPEERDDILPGALKREPCFERNVMEDIRDGPSVVIRSHIPGVTKTEHILYREEGTPNLYVKPCSSLCQQYMGYRDVLLSTPITQLNNNEYLRFDSDQTLTSRFADKACLASIGKLSICLIGDLAAKVFNTGSIDGTVWVKMVYLDGRPHIKVDTVSVNFNDPHNEKVNELFLGNTQKPRIARSYVKVDRMSYYDMVCLSRMGMNLKSQNYESAVSALVKGKTAELTAVLGKPVEIGSYSGGITSLYNEGRVASILAYFSSRRSLKEELDKRGTASNTSAVQSPENGGRKLLSCKSSNENLQTLWYEKGAWIVNHGRSRIECFLVAIAFIAIVLSVAFVAQRSDVTSDRKIELSSIIIAALVALLVEGGSLLTGERVDLRRVFTGRRIICRDTGTQFLTVKLDVAKSKKNGVRIRDIRETLSGLQASIFGECTGRVNLKHCLTLKEIAELGFKYGTDNDNRLVASHKELESGYIMVLEKQAHEILRARKEQGHLLINCPNVQQIQNYVIGPEDMDFENT